jgi:hypothetical protein
MHGENAQSDFLISPQLIGANFFCSYGKRRTDLGARRMTRIEGGKNRSAINYPLNNNNSVALVRERTIPTERPPLVGEIRANFLRIEGVVWSARRIPAAVFAVF